MPVELVGGDAGRDVPADLGERLRRDPAGDPHPLDRVGVLDLRPGVAVGRGSADVLGAGDGRRAPAAAAETRPGSQQRHGAEV